MERRPKLLITRRWPDAVEARLPLRYDFLVDPTDRKLEAEGRGLAATLDDAQIDRFVQHYQWNTQHVLREMPNRADLAIALDRERRPVAISGRSPAVKIDEVWL